MPIQKKLACTFLFVATALVAGVAKAADEIDFNRDIRPLLSNNCYQCHGPDVNTREAGLRLDQKAEALAKLESGGHAIVPGKKSDSELFQRISESDESLKMPPPESGKSLSASEIALLGKWIDQGAPWKGHWAFIPPESPKPPKTPWSELVRNPIDQFVFRRLEREGLTPASEATKETLIRRVTFDLTGLPPTPKEIDAFLADDSPEAYETVVDRLLRSPRFGEHMARYWLDAARYGDTHGLHLDNERSLWPYRDWVINAFNANKPFDEFTVEQIAGDLLPDATLDQKIATGFNRCNVTTSEGGSIKEEFRVRYAIDRTETTATVWMGLTVGCAVCHDHKFDPISQKEFYGLYAYFNNTADNAMDGNALLPPPVIKVASPEQKQKREQLGKQIADLKKQIQTAVAKIDYQEPEQSGDSTQPQEFVWIDDKLPTGAKPAGNEGPQKSWQFVEAPKPVKRGKASSMRTSKGLTQHYFTGANPPLIVGKGDVLFAHVWLDPKNPPKEIMLQFNNGSWEHRAVWGEDVIPWGTANTASRRSLGDRPALGEWVRLEVPVDQVGLKPGDKINGWAFTQHDGTAYWDYAGIITTTPQAGQTFASELVWEATQKSSGYSGLPKPVQDALKVPRDKRTEQQTKVALHYFLEHAYSGSEEILAPIRDQIATREGELKTLDQALSSTMIMADQNAMRETYVLTRGQYDQPDKSQKVGPGVPTILPPLKDDASKNRLALARWLVNPQHPLTARVIVNRDWQRYFGTGLVKTSEDFGSQGEWPSHPELLDWLATEFQRGWDIKALQKLIVMSHTYRQSSHVTPKLHSRDPENRLLARGPRFRLDAEMIRDNALAVSGLLVEKVGGKSVKPYQPQGLWKAVGYTSSNTANFKRDSGDALYRRSLYTFWKRTSPPPSMSTFDAPSREACTVRRARTNTPLQALVLLNDTQFVEASRHLAERLLTQGGKTFEDKVTLGFRLTTGRKPSSEELAVVKTLWEQQLADYQARPEAAKQLLSQGESPRNNKIPVAEHAAWTMIASVLLNLDETVTKG